MTMARWLAIAAVSLGASAHAGDEGDLAGRSKAFAARPLEAPAGPAPFNSRSDAPSAFSLAAPAVSSQRAVPCAEGLRAVCYDRSNRGLVYRGARDFMPRIEGLTPEGVAVRHDRLVLRYSFR